MRLGLFPYLGLIGALLGAQYFAVTSLEGSNAIMTALIAVQLLKVPVAAARARDLGYDGDEAVLAMLPLGNLALFWKLLEGTPNETTREHRQRVHTGESTAWELFGYGAQTLLKNPVVLVACVAVGLIDATVTETVVAQVPNLAEWPVETLQMVSQVALGLSAVLGLLLLMKLSKAATTPRASYFPVLFLPGTLATGAATAALASVSQSADPQQAMLIGVIVMGFATMPVFAIGGAWAASVAHVVGAADLRGEKVGGEAIGQATARLTEMAAPHAGVRYLINIGLQIFVVPGLMYATQYAMVDQVAWEEPEARALSRAGELSRGHRQRILRTMLIPGVGLALVMMAVGVADMGDFGKLSEVALNPFALSTWAAITGGALYAVAFAIFELSMVKMYTERSRTVAAPATEA